MPGSMSPFERSLNKPTLSNPSASPSGHMANVTKGTFPATQDVKRADNARPTSKAVLVGLGKADLLLSSMLEWTDVVISGNVSYRDSHFIAS